MLVLVTRMMASLGSLIAGSGTVSTEIFRRPCHVTARISILLYGSITDGVPAAAAGKPAARIGSFAPRGDGALALLAVDGDVDVFVEEADPSADELGVVQRFVIGPRDVARTVGHREVVGAALVRAVGRGVTGFEADGDVLARQ